MKKQNLDFNQMCFYVKPIKTIILENNYNLHYRARSALVAYEISTEKVCVHGTHFGTIITKHEAIMLFEYVKNETPITLEEYFSRLGYTDSTKVDIFKLKYKL